MTKNFLLIINENLILKCEQLVKNRKLHNTIKLNLRINSTPPSSLAREDVEPS